MRVTVYRRGEQSSIVRAGDIPELRTSFAPEPAPAPGGGDAEPALTHGEPDAANPAAANNSKIVEFASPETRPGKTGPTRFGTKGRSGAIVRHLATVKPAQAEARDAEVILGTDAASPKEEMPAFLPLARYADFTGRSRRAEFWSFMPLALGAIILGSAMSRPIGILVLIGLLIPMLAVTVRRLHDIKASGWWILLMLVPYVGPLIVLVLLIVPGSAGHNRFGGDPLQSARDRATPV
ncbi:MAG: DUF805 domain-containing protein [Sphingomonas sp.]